jgi:hypothetical protein
MRDTSRILRSGSDGPSRHTVAIREAIFACMTLAVVGILAFAPHILNGGFYLDDWANGAGALRPPGGPGVAHALSYFDKLTIYRPVLVLYVPLTYFVFGTHMAYQLAWAALLAIGVGAAVYGILRTLGVPLLHAWLIAAITIVYPWYDSTRLWETASQATLSILFVTCGLLLAITGLRRRSLRLHGCAATLYLLSILTYEVTLPFIAAAGVLYVLLAGWRLARPRWAMDLVAVLAGGLWVGLQTSRESLGVSADLRHLGEIITSGGTILGRSLIAFGQPRTEIALVIVAVIAVMGFGLIYVDRSVKGQNGNWGPQNWLMMTGGGLVVATLGWIMYIPANPYYTPSVYGFTNRVNALAGFGLVIAVYGTFGIVGSITGRIWSRVKPSQVNLCATITTATLALVLGGVYVQVLERHTRIWDSAFRAEMAGIGEMRTQYPQLPHGVTLFTSDYPANQTLGVPIFSSSWDVNGMVKLQYKDGTLSAYPVLPGLTLVCRETGIGLQGPGAPIVNVSYGKALLLDVHTGGHARPIDRRECNSTVGGYTPGPLYLSTNY